jgi:hypothetical protein
MFMLFLTGGLDDGCASVNRCTRETTAASSVAIVYLPILPAFYSFHYHAVSGTP